MCDGFGRVLGFSAQPTGCRTCDWARQAFKEGGEGVDHRLRGGGVGVGDRVEGSGFEDALGLGTGFVRFTTNARVMAL